MNYMEQLMSVREKIYNALSNVGNYDLDMYKYMSNHPHYNHIFIVLARDVKDRYVTFEFHNLGKGQLQHGIYAIPTLAQAMEDVKRREFFCEAYEENPAFFVQAWNVLCNGF